MACVVFSQILSCLLFMSSGDLEICVPVKRGCIACLQRLLISCGKFALQKVSEVCRGLGRRSVGLSEGSECSRLDFLQVSATERPGRADVAAATPFFGGVGRRRSC